MTPRVIVLFLLGLVLAGGVSTAVASPYLAAQKTKASTPAIAVAHTETNPCEQFVRRTPHLFANDLQKESRHAFGPPVSAKTTPQVLQELVERLCLDPQLFKAVSGKLFSKPLNRRLSARAWSLERRQLFTRIDHTCTKVRTVQYPAGSWTLYMYGKNAKIGVAPYEHDTTDRILQLCVRSGETLTQVDLRLKCGFQPKGPRRHPD